MNEITNFTIQPKTLTEAMDFAKMIASSSFCPTAMKGKPGDVLLSLQMGAEVGLSPMQALQSIAIISGKPCLWGDGALAVAMSNPNYVSHREWFEGSIKDNNLVAYCAMTRKGSEEYIRAFGMDEAKKAGLWSKPGVWQSYPDRMLQMRARSFAIRDKFADSLKGIIMAEEVNDYEKPTYKAQNVRVVESSTSLLDMTPEVIDVQTGELIEPPKQPEKSYPNPDLASYADYMSLIGAAKTMDMLKETFIKATTKFKSNPHFIENLTKAKDEAKERLLTELDLARLPLEDENKTSENVNNYVED